MNNSIKLMPNLLKKISILVFVPSLMISLVFMISNYQFDFLEIPVFTILSTDFLKENVPFSIQTVNFTFTFFSFLVMVSGLGIVFSKEKMEDEFIQSLRLKSMMFSFLVSHFITLMGILFIYNLSFLSFMCYNMFTMLIVYILHFQLSLYKSKKGNEE